MTLPRIIPCLLLQKGRLVKTRCFENPIYVGDPINTVRIFNEKEVDELFLIDVSATAQARHPDFDLLSKISREAFMPLGYGGGISNVQEIQRLLSLGFEKVIINNAALNNLEIIRAAAERCGSQSVVVSIDVKKDFWGRPRLYNHVKRKFNNRSPTAYAVQAVEAGGGEILLTSVDREGTMEGFDCESIRDVSKSISVPVVASGGAGSLDHFGEAIRCGASGVAAGSFFVFHGPHRAVLITYPSRDEISQALSSQREKST
ncbi:MAG: imidazole glycerol phosphate synthase subunit HisF [Elusimicrobia bacterium]|jgi:cyclase|nr:imidazole glycerol phosphate synthase subunit HisF [Elusimicrobiota bacterium]